MGCVARVEELRKMYKILAAHSGRDHSVELILLVKIILKLILKRKIITCELNSHSGRRREEACCKSIVKIYVQK